MALSRLNVLYLCAGLCCIDLVRIMTTTSKKLPHVLHIQSNSIRQAFQTAQGEKYKKKKERSRFITLESRKRMIYGQTQRGRLLNILNNKNQEENEKKTKTSCLFLNCRLTRIRHGEKQKFVNSGE